MLHLLCTASVALSSSGVGPLPSTFGGKLPALSGPVATGFGRGSKKLGVPTANLPCSLFQQQLDDLPRGVYVGWAAVRGGVHRCVCNVGMSPTFAETNPEKIVEAHLMAEFDGDFYGETMRLLLLGFIRDERKFGSLDELLTTIRADIATANAALEAQPFAALASTPWLKEAVADDAAAEYRLLSSTSSDDGTVAQQGAAAAPAKEAGEQFGIPPKGFEWGGLY